ncbi:uracil-DNA glycosylase [Acidithiobacillus sulfurivorans]|uniref:Type-4 uracil-DNA glycosylase n=1 Tax=Acidithiobacillus sulfurivorans TaxID=1958756 RepID=A0ABS5ZXE2_9PROT|nr:uracil-DNA glycosylase [Acidithiobacillus sulfurivorans]MBU2759681.1 uracil-DNA glycosylase [Acidithiobacillus sulfurivorans]
MSEIFTIEQRQFLKLLGLAVPGESPVLPPLKNQAVSAPAQAAAEPKIPESIANSLEAPEGISTLRAAAGILSARPKAVGVPQPVTPEPQQKIQTEPEAVSSLSELPTPAESGEPQRLQQVSASDWRDLQIMVNNCRACSLGETRQHAVFGAGNPRGSWLFVGEAPGAEEDRRGEAFVGRGGQLLDNMLKAMDLTRQQDVYIANVLKCRPPNNRDPLGPEVQSCLPFLQRQIALLQPRIIVALGRFAAQSLLQVTTPIGQLRGQTHQYQNIPLIVTYHPAYLLRSPLEKRKAWEDLQLAVQVYSAQSLPE